MSIILHKCTWYQPTPQSLLIGNAVEGVYMAWCLGEQYHEVLLSCGGSWACLLCQTPVSITGLRLSRVFDLGNVEIFANPSSPEIPLTVTQNQFFLEWSGGGKLGCTGSILACCRWQQHPTGIALINYHNSLLLFIRIQTSISIYVLMNPAIGCWGINVEKLEIPGALDFSI